MVCRPAAGFWAVLHHGDSGRRGGRLSGLLHCPLAEASEPRRLAGPPASLLRVPCWSRPPRSCLYLAPILSCRNPYLVATLQCRPPLAALSAAGGISVRHPPHDVLHISRDRISDRDTESRPCRPLGCSRSLEL